MVNRGFSLLPLNQKLNPVSRFKRSGKRNEIFLTTKFGSTGDSSRAINGDPEYVKAAFEKSRQLLGVDVVDLYYAHRADKTVPIEVRIV